LKKRKKRRNFEEEKFREKSKWDQISFGDVVGNFDFG